VPVPMLGLLRATAWLAVVLCLLRGLPVIAGALARSWAARPPADLAPQ
jgi:hypothetical protein